MADLLRLAVSAFHADDQPLVQNLLTLVERALREGDEAVQNAVCVSFVENVGYGDGETQAFLRLWPPGLAAERERQASWPLGE